MGAAAAGLTDAQLPEALAGRLGDPVFGPAVALEPARGVLAHGLVPQREFGAARLALAPEQADLSDATHLHHRPPRAVTPLTSRLTSQDSSSGGVAIRRCCRCTLQVACSICAARGGRGRRGWLPVGPGEHAWFAH